MLTQPNHPADTANDSNLGAKELAHHIYALIDEKQWDSAASAINLFQERFPDQVAFAHYLNGWLARHQGHLAQAVEYLSQAVAENPNDQKYLELFGTALISAGHLEQAYQVVHTLLVIDPTNEQGLFNLAMLELLANHWGNAIQILTSVIKQYPINGLAHVKLAEALMAQSEDTEAQHHLDIAATLIPENPEFLYAAAKHSAMAGSNEKSLRYLEKLCEIAPNSGHAYYMMANAAKYTKSDLALAERLEHLLSGSLVAGSRDHIQFALAKIYSDMKEWDKAFTHLTEANNLRFRGHSLNAITSQTERSIKRYRRFDFSSSPKGSDSNVPIFVVGMPRSGTTLIDQVLSSHSQIGSIGESNHIQDSATFICSQPPRMTYPDCIINMDEVSLKQQADHYLANARESNMDKKRILDKMPGNYIYLGYIHTLFPNAHIIHSRRHPLDSTLSCYFQRFTATDPLDWSHNLTTLGKYYRLYSKMMAFWYQALPGKILDVHYENMVIDLESQARRIIDFVGLEWEDSCLEFHQSKRTVHTASLWQVRQPIYTSSLAKWKPYAKHLRPLIEALGDVLTEQDYEEIRAAGLDIRYPKKSFFSKLFQK